MSRDITLLINRSEITAGTRGASLGPDAIFTAARKNNNPLFVKYPIEEHLILVLTIHHLELLHRC
jgi:arginase